MTTACASRATTRCGTGSLAATAAQKKHPGGCADSSRYCMRHGAQSRCMEGAGPAPTSDGLADLALRVPDRLPVDAELQLLADLEERYALRGDRYDGARLRVPTLARLAVLDDEAAEAADLDALT